MVGTEGRRYYTPRGGEEFCLEKTGRPIRKPGLSTGDALPRHHRTRQSKVRSLRLKGMSVLGRWSYLGGKFCPKTRSGATTLSPNDALTPPRCLYEVMECCSSSEK